MNRPRSDVDLVVDWVASTPMPTLGATISTRLTRGVIEAARRVQVARVDAKFFFCVSVYDRPDGRRVVHTYTGPQGTGYPTRSKARTANARSLRGIRERHGDDVVDALLKAGSLTFHVCEALPL